MKSRPTKPTDKSFKNDRKAPSANYRFIWRGSYLIVLLLLSLGAIYLITGALSISGDYLRILRWSYLPTYILIAPVLGLLIAGKKLSPTSRYVANGLSILVLLGLGFYAQGAVPDMFGARCTGFFNSPMSCADLNHLLLTILIFHPYVLLSLIGLTFLLSAKGWFDYFYYSDRK